MDTDQGAAGEAVSEGQIAAESALSGFRPLVFIVEDDEESAASIGAIAEREGCNVSYFKYGSEVAARLRKEKPYMMFLSYTPNDRNFLPLCKLAQMTNVAVIATAELLSKEDVFFALQSGVVDFLLKPYNEQTSSYKVLNGLAFAKEVLSRTEEVTATISGNSEMSMKDKIEALKAKTQQLMALPQVTTNVISLCSNPKVNAAQLKEVVKVDPALSAALIKRVNSAGVRGIEKISSLQAAIVRLGYRTVRAIATLTSVFDLSGAETTSFAFDRFGHWVHSLAVGLIAEQISTLSKIEKPEDVFLAGILHDFGKLVFDDYMHEDYMNVCQMAGENGLTVNEGEQEIFGIAHDAIGEHVALRWNLPEPICSAIGSHHKKTPAAEGESKIGRIVHMANLMAKAMLLGRSGNPCDEMIDLREWEAFGLSKLPLGEFRASMMCRIREFLRLLRAPDSKLALIAPPDMEDAWVSVEDGGKTDRLIDVFFIGQGYRVLHPVDELPEKPPSFILHDLRQMEEGETRTCRAESGADTVHMVVKRMEQSQPDHIPAEAVVLDSPIDFLAMLQAIRR